MNEKNYSIDETNTSKNITRRKFFEVAGAAVATLTLVSCLQEKKLTSTETDTELTTGSVEHISEPEKDPILLDGKIVGMTEEEFDDIRDQVEQLGYTSIKTYCILDDANYNKYVEAGTIGQICFDYSIPFGNREAFMGRVIEINCQTGRTITNTKNGKTIVGDGTGFLNLSEENEYDLSIIIFGTEEQCASQEEERS